MKSDPSAAATTAAAAAAIAAAAADGTPDRDFYAKTEEERGIISFPVIFNDSKADHMVALIGLKNIFSAQLPKMPKVRVITAAHSEEATDTARATRGRERGRECIESACRIV